MSHFFSPFMKRLSPNPPLDSFLPASASWQSLSLVHQNHPIFIFLEGTKTVHSYISAMDIRQGLHYVSLSFFGTIPSFYPTYTSLLHLHNPTTTTTTTPIS